MVLQGLAFFSDPLFSRLLGTNNYGIASVYLTWVQISSIVFSLQAAGTFSVARVYFPSEDQKRYQSSVLGLSTLSYLGFSLLAILGVFIASRWIKINFAMIIWGLIHGWGLYCVSAINSKFTYEFSAGKNFLLSVLTSAITIIMSLILINAYPLDTNYWGRIIGQSAVYGCIGIVLFVCMLRVGKTFYNKEYWKFTLPIAIPTIFHLLAHIILNQSDKLMIQNIISNSAAGIYALAHTFSAVLSTLYQALNNSWVPFYYEYNKQNQLEKIKAHSKNYIELFTILTMGFILVAKEVFQIYAKASFWEGTDLIPLFAIGSYFIFLYSFPVNYEFYNKKTKSIAMGTSLASACNIVLNIIFILLWGIKGAVIATIVAHGLQFAFHYICARRIDQGNFTYRISDFLPGLLAVCLTCAMYFFTKDLWIIRWIFALILGIFILLRIVKRKEIF